MKKVLDQYVKAIAKQLNRRNRQGRTEFTRNENKAIAYYGRAVQQVQGLMDQGTGAQCPQQP
jgi:hypothetical protein